MISRAHHRTLGRVLTGLMFVVLASSAQAQLPAPSATGAPTSFTVTVTKVELLRGTTYVEIFNGASELDLVTAGTFPDVANLALPPGTYTAARVTILNSLRVTGSLVSGATRYVTSTDGCVASGNAAGCTDLSAAGTTAPGAEFVFRNPAWGTLGESTTLSAFTLATPVTVTTATDYQPTLTFSVAGTLQLYNLGAGGFVFGITAPTVSFN